MEEQQSQTNQNSAIFQPAPPEPTAPGQLYYATFSRRFLAALLDGIILLIVGGIVTSILNFITGHKNNDGLFNLVGIAYWLFITWKYGATLGKQVMKIKVVSGKGTPLTFIQVFLREIVGKFLSAFLLLGYISVLWDKKRQGWHDKIADTYVVTSIPNDGKTSKLAAVAAILFLALPIIGILAVVVLVAINPMDTLKKARDSRRMADLNTVNAQIQAAKAQNPKLSFCSRDAAPCIGQSNDPGAEMVDGTGWVKVPVEGTLPVDPTNTSGYVYQYCSDGKDYTLMATLERSTKDQMTYKVGSVTTLCSDPVQ